MLQCYCVKQLQAYSGIQYYSRCIMCLPSLGPSRDPGQIFPMLAAGRAQHCMPLHHPPLSLRFIVFSLFRRVSLESSRES